MRITFVSYAYWPMVGGMQVFLHHLARALGARHEVTVLARRVGDGDGYYDRFPWLYTRFPELLPMPPFEPFDDGPVRVEQLRYGAGRRLQMSPIAARGLPVVGRYAYGPLLGPLTASYAAAAGPVLARACRGSDVLHMWGPDLLLAAAVRAGRLNDQPVVVTPIVHPGQWGDDPGSVRNYGAAARVIALLDTEAAVYRGLGVPAASIETIPVCSPAVPTGGGAKIRERHGITGHLVLFLGVRRPYKGSDLLLRAAPLVAAAHPDASFAFVGPGPALGDLPAGVRVVDAGAVSDEERADWLDAATLLCLPSSHEVLPVSILEAWSLGKPVVTSDIPTLTELVGTSGAGLCAPRTPAGVAGALGRLLDDPTLARQLGAAGRDAWTSRYAPDRVATCHERLYESLLRDHAPSSRPAGAANR